MPRPARSPSRYSNSTVWWPCPLCSKSCKSKAGRLRHVRAKHGNATLSLSDVESFETTILDLESEPPVQFRQGSSSPFGQQSAGVDPILPIFGKLTPPQVR